jgi:hypothetical protein
MAIALERPEIDFLILADSAEAINGKLYMLGGGWDRLSVANYEQPVVINFALGMLVPWTSANENLPIRLFIEQADGRPLEPRADGSINVGRPPVARPGQSFRVVVAVKGAFRLPGAGAYRVVAQIADSQEKRVAFEALPQGQPA